MDDFYLLLGELNGKNRKFLVYIRIVDKSIFQGENNGGWIRKSIALYTHKSLRDTQFSVHSLKSETETTPSCLWRNKNEQTNIFPVIQISPLKWVNGIDLRSNTFTKCLTTGMSCQNTGKLKYTLTQSFLEGSRHAWRIPNVNVRSGIHQPSLCLAHTRPEFPPQHHKN